MSLHHVCKTRKIPTDATAVPVALICISFGATFAWVVGINSQSVTPVQETSAYLSTSSYTSYLPRTSIRLRLQGDLAFLLHARRSCCAWRTRWPLCQSGDSNIPCQEASRVAPVRSVAASRFFTRAKLRCSENRLYINYVALPFLISGLVLLGYALGNGYHYMLVSLGWGLYVFGIMLATTGYYQYLLDCYGEAAGEVYVPSQRQQWNVLTPHITGLAG